jgi:hypothetical protein
MNTPDGFTNINELINRFGGMRPMARKVDVPLSTIQGWKKRNHIPSERIAEVVAAAKLNQISLDGYRVAANTPIQADAPKASDSTAAPSPSPVAPRVPPPTRTAPIQLNAGKIKRDAVTRSVVTTLSILGVLGGVGYFLFGQEAKEIVTIAKDQKQIESRFDGISQQYTSFENTVTNGLNAMSDRVTDVAAAVGVERNAKGEVVLNNNMSLSERVTGLESRLRSAGEEIDLGQLMNRFETMTQPTAGTSPDTALALNDLRLVIDALQSRMNEFDMALTDAKQGNAELSKSLENVTGRDMSAAAMLLAMTQMRSSLNSQKPFDDDLAILQELVGNEDPELTSSIARLAPYAESGVLSPQGLSSEFRGIAGEILAAALRGENVSVQDKIMGRIGQILSVEKDGKPIMGIKEQTIISNAQKSLDDGDVAGALRALNQLEGDAANVAQPFKSQAMGTINAENAVSMMMENLLGKLQNPTQLKSMIQNLPAELGKQMQGDVRGSIDSGLIILE